jgi:hypothetical protein
VRAAILCDPRFVSILSRRLSRQAGQHQHRVSFSSFLLRLASYDIRVSVQSRWPPAPGPGTPGPTRSADAGSPPARATVTLNRLPFTALVTA